MSNATNVTIKEEKNGNVKETVAVEAQEINGNVKEEKVVKMNNKKSEKKKDNILEVKDVIELLKLEIPQNIKIKLSGSKVSKDNKACIWETGGLVKNNGYAILAANNSFLPKLPLMYNKKKLRKNYRGLIPVIIGDHVGFCVYISNKSESECRIGVYKVIEIKQQGKDFICTLTKVLENEGVYTKDGLNKNQSLFISKLLQIALNKSKRIPLWSIPWEIFKSKLNFWFEIQPEGGTIVNISDIDELYFHLSKHSKKDKLLLTVHKYILEKDKIRLQIQPIRNDIHDLFIDDEAMYKKNPTEEEIERISEKLQNVLTFSEKIYELEITDNNYIFIRDWFLMFRKRNLKSLIEYLEKKIDGQEANEKSLMRVFKF